LGLKLKRIEDVPHASSNAVAILLLLKLSIMTGKENYRSVAEQTLKIFVASASEMSVHAGAYFCALDAWFNMITLTVEAVPDSALARSARLLSGKVYTTIIYGENNNRVVPCKQRQCYEPQSDPDSLSDFCFKL
jgi:uncharacterized protein YyaL (SSP411 family)